MNDLYPNALLSIFVHLDINSIANCLLANKKFKKAIDKEYLWKTLLESKHGESNKYEKIFGSKTCKETYLICHSIDKLKKQFPQKPYAQDSTRIVVTDPRRSPTVRWG